MRQIHITNGDAATIPLRNAGLAGRVSTYADVLHEGPVPPDWPDMHAWIETRARFIAAEGYVAYDEAVATQLEWQSVFDRHAEYDDIVLWFEHDLFDQLLLIRHLAWFRRAGRTTGLELICGDRYLGHLDPKELAALYPTREPVGAAQLDLASGAWTAFTTSDPRSIQSLLEQDTRALPYLRGALVRFLEEYPWTTHGLGRIDAQLLAVLAERPHTLTALFEANARREERIFLGDAVFWVHVRKLMHARVPLVRMQAGNFHITDAGREVVAGKADAIALHGIDRWLGGVHLDRDAWRWDPVTRGVSEAGNAGT